MLSEMQGIIAQLFALAVRLTRVYQHRRRTVRRNRGGDETLSRIHFFSANNSFGLFIVLDISRVVFSARLGLKFLVCLCFALGGRLTRDSEQKQASIGPQGLPP